MAFESIFRQAIRKLSREHAQKSRTRKLRFDDLGERINPATGTVSFLNLNDTVAEGATGDVARIAVRLVTDNVSMNNDLLVKIRDISPGGVGWATPESAPAPYVGPFTDPNDYVRPDPSAMTTNNTPQPNTIHFNTASGYVVFRTNQQPIAVVNNNLVYEQILEIPLNNDRRIESDEMFRLELGLLAGDIVNGTYNNNGTAGTITDDFFIPVPSPTDAISKGGTFQSTVTIDDNDTATVTFAGPTTAVEGGGNGAIAATLSFTTPGTGPQALDIDVAATIQNTADYTASTVTWMAGSAPGTQNIVITALDDWLVEANLENHTGVPVLTPTPASGSVAIAGTAPITIDDNDTATLALTAPGATSLNESSGTSTLGVTLTLNTQGNLPTTGNPVGLAVDITATLPGNGDYTASTYTFNPQTVTTVGSGMLAARNDNITSGAGGIVIQATDDQLVEDYNEVYNTQLLQEGVPNNTADVTYTTDQDITIVDDNDTATFSITPGTTTVTEGGLSQNVVVTLTLTTTGAGTQALAIPVTVDFNENGDYTTAAASFAANSNTGTTSNIVVAAINDVLIELKNEGQGTHNLQIITPNTVPTRGPVGQHIVASGTQTIAVNDNDSAVVNIVTPGTTTVAEGATANVPVQLTLIGNGVSGAGVLATDITVGFAPTSSGYPTAASFDFNSSTTTSPLFPSGTATATVANVVVSGLDDLLLEGTETFNNQPLVLPTATVNVSSGTTQNIVITDTDTATITITAAGANTSVTEGAASPTNMQVTLTTTGGVTLAVPVSVKLQDNSDYSSTVATFAAGAGNNATADVPVSAVNDWFVEPQETFNAQNLIFDPSTDASVVSAIMLSGTRDIVVNDNETANIAIGTGSTTLTEGGAPQNVTATLTITGSGTGTKQLQLAGGSIQANLNIAGDVDYTSALANFADGSNDGATANVVLDDVDDRYVESATESFGPRNLQITNNGGASAAATGSRTINVNDNDTATVNIFPSGGTYALTEGQAGLPVQVQLALTTTGTGPSELAVPVTASFAGNADYSTSTAATFSPGVPAERVDGAMKNVTIVATDDRLVEAVLETFTNQTLSLSSTATPPPTFLPATSGSITVTVAENDSAVVSIPAAPTINKVTLTEGVTTNLPTFPVTITLNTTGVGAASTALLDVPVVVTLTPGDNDFTVSGNAIFDPSDILLGPIASGATRNLTLMAVDDNLVEASPELAVGGPQYLMLVPNANPVPGNGNITLSGSSGQLIVEVNDNDYARLTYDGVVTVVEGNSTPSIVTAKIEYIVAPGGTGPVQLDVVVQAKVISATNDFTSNTAQWNPGEAASTKNIEITAFDDRFLEAFSENADGVLQPITEAQVQVLGTVNVTTTDTTETGVVSIPAGPTGVTEGGGTANIAATLTLASSSGQGTLATEVPVMANIPNNADFTTTAATFESGWIPANGTRNIVVTAVNDELVEPSPESFAGLGLTVSGTTNATPHGTLNTHTVDVTDNDEAVFTISNATATEGDSMTFTVTLAKAIQHTENIDVRVNFAAGSALLSDFDETSVNLAFLPGVANQSFDVTVATDEDNIVEAMETFTASLQLLESLPTHNINVSDTGTGTITDDDTATFTIENVTVTEGTAVSFAVVTSNPLDTNINIGVSYTDQTATGGSDYDSSPDNAAFTFTPTGVGATTINVTVGTNNDNIVEAVETFLASMSTNTVLGGRSVVFSDTAIGTINDNDNAIFQIDDVTINEGGNTATFTVSTSNPIDIDVAIDVSYAGFSANPATGGNVDFDSLTDSVTFSALSTANRTVTVAIVDDNIVEATEQFQASLNSTTTLNGRTITTTDKGLGTITDNDTATFTINDVAVTEGGTISFTVSVDKVIDIPVGIDVGYAGGTALGSGTDYDSGTDTANFAANTAAPQTVNVLVTTNNDNIVEAVETFLASLTLNSGTNLNGRSINLADTSVGTINDNDIAIFTIDDVTVTEGAAISFAVTLDKEIDIPVAVSVNYAGGNATGGGTDYDSIADTANFAKDVAGSQTINVSVPTNNDNIVEAIETFLASLSTSTALGGRSVNLTDTGVGTINDNDTAIFTIDDSTANESAGTMTFTISVSNPIDIPVAIDIGYTGAPTAPFTASGAGVDFDSTGGTTATFLALSTTPRQVTVAITNDNIVEATETFRAALSTPTALGGRSLTLTDTATGSITDNDVATFLIDSPTVNESAGTITFNVSVDNPIDIPVTITSTYTSQTATGGGTDFTSTNGSATFAANVTAAQSITVPINNDDVVEATETFLASISTSTPLGGRTVVTTDTGVGSIIDNDTAIISIDNVTVNEAAGTATFAITSDKQIDIPLSVSVNYGGGTATGGLDYDSGTDIVNLPALSTGPVNVSVNIFNDSLSEATETFIASLSSSTALGGRSVNLADTGTGTITDNDTATFTIDDVTVNEGAGTATFTLKVTNPLDIDVAIDVNYAGGTAVAGTDYDNATDSVTFVANSTADRTVTVALTNDNIVEATETFLASLSSPTNLGGRTINVADTATGTIQDNDTATFTIDDVIVEEGSVATFTVSLSNPIDTNVTVNVSYAGSGANPATGGGVDFDSATDSVTFNSGTTDPQTVTVQTTAEALNETIETFLASLSTTTPLGGRSVSLSDTGTGTIIDHNEAPVLTVPQSAFTFQVNTPLTIQGVTATDTEIALQAPNAQALQATISVGNGTVTLATTAGLTFVTGDGTQDATMTFTGNIASVQAALASLTYRPTADTLVPDAMTITVSDLGTLGAGGVMTDTETITLNTLSNLVQSQPSPLTPAINDLVVYGTTGNDNILVQYGSRGFVITVNGVRSAPFGGVKGRVVVFGSDGNDTITVAPTISRGTYLDGGSGDDSLRGGKGRDTLTGGQGTDTLNGGAGFDQLYEKADTNFTLVGGTRRTDGSLTTGGLGNDVLVRNYIESAFLVGGDSANTINTTAFAGPVTLMGGEGDDNLSSGRHHDVLVGGTGADTLNGGDGKDLLIGGTGLDNLTGGNHDDILVGSTTSFDADAIALGRIRSEWIRTDVALHLRINHINGLAPRGGKNGTTRLNSSSVFNDTTNDVFTGGAGNDYFVNFLGEPLADFAGLDRQANITITP